MYIGGLHANGCLLPSEVFEEMVLLCYFVSYGDLSLDIMWTHTHINTHTHTDQVLYATSGGMANQVRAYFQCGERYRSQA